jgi:hypothetical protein
LELKKQFKLQKVTCTKIMWIQGNFRDRSCEGHATEEVGENGDMVWYCEIITEDMGNGMMKIEFINPIHSITTFVFCIGRYFSVERGGEVLAEATDDGMMITPPGDAGVFICSFEGQQLRVSFQFGGFTEVSVLADMV